MRNWLFSVVSDLLTKGI